MSKWVRKLNIVSEWKVSNENEALVYKTADSIAKKLKAFNVQGDGVLDELIEDFELLAEDEEANYDSFNYYMEKLYSWADTPLDNEWNGKKNCWIETF